VEGAVSRRASAPQQLFSIHLRHPKGTTMKIQTVLAAGAFTVSSAVFIAPVAQALPDACYNPPSPEIAQECQNLIQQNGPTGNRPVDTTDLCTATGAC
jgi:hypothetical protein